MKQHVIIDIGLILVTAGVQILGVLLWGWSIGNIILLLWFENLVLSIVAILRMFIYRKTEGFKWSNAFMYSFQMLFFTSVHLSFSAILAFSTGVEVTAIALYLPAALIVARTLLDAVWQAATPPRQFSQTYGVALRRIIMLHVSLLLCWYLMIRGIAVQATNPDSAHIDSRLVILAVLLGVKTAVEIVLVVSDAKPRQVHAAQGNHSRVSYERSGSLVDNRGRGRWRRRS